MHKIVVTLLAVAFVGIVGSRIPAEENTDAVVQGKVLFDFEDPTQAASWKMWQFPKPEKGRAPKPEPDAKVEVEFAGEGGVRNGRLKITYAGGVFPTVDTAAIPADLTPWGALKADVTVGRAMVVGFRIKQEKDNPAQNTSAWLCTVLLKPGPNAVSLSLKKPQRFRTRSYSAREGKALSLAFIVYSPQEGETVYVDNIRVTTEDDPDADNRSTPNLRPKDGYKVLGTDLTVRDVDDLGKKLAADWKKPEKDKTVEERETEFKELYEAITKKHPKAVMVTFREGEKGCDAKDPEKTYKGWEHVHVNSHGPDGLLRGRANGRVDYYGKLELFMRHRSQLIRVDVSSIPKGSKVLAARLLLVSQSNRPVDKPNMFAAEACNRPWVEGEVNAYRYAKGKLWRNVSGQYYEGDDPDYLPLYLAYGPAQGKTNVWDFTRAVKWWVEEGNANHGFFLHGNAVFYASTYTKGQKDPKNRPALVVIYEP